LIAGARAADKPLLAVGLGRSYGDTALNSEGVIIDTSGLTRIRAFDPAAGVLRADPGLSLSAIADFAIPRGWFPPVLPGTQHVTVAGAIANDVHGKNHHSAGSFGHHVLRLCLLRTDGMLEVLDRTDPTGRFAATIGGLGLTGVIAWADLQLAPLIGTRFAYEQIPFGNLNAYFDLAAESAETHLHTVAWVDCAAGGPSLGRGIFSRANPLRVAARSRPNASLRIPFDGKPGLLSAGRLKRFNALYFGLKVAQRRRLTADYKAFLFPLDRLRDWNRLYGADGFYQYQCAVPHGCARDSFAEILQAIAKAGDGSFLAVLKTFGRHQPLGCLSFPRPGVTLALDFPNRGAETLQLLNRLDRIVDDAGGWLYPAKDGRMDAAMFERSFPAHVQFRAHVDPGISSDFWRRVS
jgi:FAD/FMN-containing dehydrogenase